MPRPAFTQKDRDQYANHQHKAKFKTPEDEWENYTRHQVRVCSKCKEEKGLVFFKNNSSGSCGFDKEGYRLRRPECFDCNKKACRTTHKKTKPPPGQACEICTSTDKALVYDHSHQTGAFRGWLCDPCNRSLGGIGDNIEGVIRVANYLLKKEPNQQLQLEDGFLSVL